MRPRRLLLLTLAGSLLTACGNAAPGEDAGASRAAAPAGASCTPGTSRLDGASLVVPAGARPGRTPLIVVVIPGGRGDPSDRLGVRAAATREGAAVLYPTTPGGFWTLNARQGTAQIGQLRTLLDDVVAQGCVDPDRLTATGVSNGAGFVARLACALPGRFRAIAPVAAGLKALDPCPATSRASVLEIHGGADTVVPFRGAKPDRKGNVVAWAGAWARRNGCGATPAVVHPARLVTRYRFAGCRAGRRVEVRLLRGTDHGWPGSGPPFPSHNPSGADATPLVVGFLLGA